MSSLTLEYTNCLASSIGATHGLTDAEIDTLVAKFPKHHENIEEVRSSGESAFFELPYQDLKPLKDLIKVHKGKWDNILVIGTSGACYGPMTLIESLCHEHWNLLPDKLRKGPRVIAVNNADPATLSGLFDAIDAKKTLLLCISRSGNSAETNGMLLHLLAQLKKRAGKGSPANQVLIATDTERSPLTEVIKAEKCGQIHMPTNLSNRFGVLHAASLLPAALCGVDIEALLAGAAAMDERCRHDRAMDNPAYMHSLIHYLLTRKRRKTIHAHMGFSNRLRPIVNWYDHLLGVSLGKMLNKKGKAVHVGPGPAAAIGPADCYGQMQLWQEGPFDKVITFITATDHGGSIEVPAGYAKVEGLAYLAGAKIADIMDQAYVAAVQVITMAGRPSMTVRLDNISPASLGGYFYMMQLSTVMSAELYGIDAFDHPGVDLNKQGVFGQLGRAGFEDKGASMAEYRKRPVRSC